MIHFSPFFILMSETHGEFGFNGNILETNIINLAAVVAIVISFVGKNLTSLLEDRKKTILNNLQEANQRAIEAKEKLTAARIKLDLAKKKAEEIRSDGLLRAAQEVYNCEVDHELRISRLSIFERETKEFYQQKAFKQVSAYVISRIMTKVREKLANGLDNKSHIVVNTYFVNLFAEFVTNNFGVSNDTPVPVVTGVTDIT